MGVRSHRSAFSLDPKTSIALAVTETIASSSTACVWEEMIVTIGSFPFLLASVQQLEELDDPNCSIQKKKRAYLQSE